jgi:uncharacterized membrane protein YfhO
MKKETKKDILYCTLLVLTFLVLVFKLVDGTYLFGSSLDWYSQHISIPEYFRTLFYHTKDLFPDFALNIGNGQNIYNFSYYGLFSPSVFISYLFPKVSMTNYMIISTIITTILSGLLMYLFLKKKKYSSEICFLCSAMLILSAPLSFHSHRHIMFINYMPFLILGLMGVDKKINDNKSWLLILGTFLMIMTSYYYSIGGIGCIFVYALYLYLQKQKKVTFKSFFNTLFAIAGPIIVAVLASSIITFPTLAAMFNNRLPSNVHISFKDLFFLKNNYNNLLYDTYSIGLTAIAIPALINIFKKNKANIVLGIILSCLVLFNIFNYILNGTMYIDSKSLIPFLPLYILVIAEFVNDVLNKKINKPVLIPILIIISIWIGLDKEINIHYLAEIIGICLFIFLYEKWPKKSLIIIPLFLLASTNAYLLSKNDTLELKYEIKENEQIISNSLETITTMDPSFYRTSLDLNRTIYPNKNFSNINYYNSTIYSSISSSNYNTFYYDELANNMQARNRALTVTTSNIFSLMLSNNKYIISRNKPLQGYELISSDNGLNIYRNNNTLPLGFATSNVMSYEDFKKLSFFEQQEAYLNLIVADTKTKNTFVSNMQETDIDLKTSLIHANNVKLEKDGSISINAEDNQKIDIPIPEEYQNKILLIRFKMNNESSYRDLTIRINGIQNKITATSWKYYNGNKVFDYVLAFQNQSTLNISFTKGEYNLSDFEVYAIDYSYLEKAVQNISKFNINKETTKGDVIEGTINVIDDGYFMLTIPYDNGFNIKVDNKDIKYEKVDYSFIGFPIKEGTHTIRIEYHSPLKNLAIVTTLIGVVGFVLVTYLESKRKI